MALCEHGVLYLTNPLYFAAIFHNYKRFGINSADIKSFRIQGFLSLSILSCGSVESNNSLHEPVLYEQLSGSRRPGGGGCVCPRRGPRCLQAGVGQQLMPSPCPGGDCALGTGRAPPCGLLVSMPCPGGEHTLPASRATSLHDGAAPSVDARHTVLRPCAALTPQPTWSKVGEPEVGWHTPSVAASHSWLCRGHLWLPDRGRGDCCYQQPGVQPGPHIHGAKFRKPRVGPSQAGGLPLLCTDPPCSLK